MNIRPTISVVVLLFLALAFSAGQSKKKIAKHSCWDTAKTQAELNDCAATDAQKADAELNRVYSALLQKLKNDAVALESLKESERQWLKYRDAQMKALHPQPEDEGSGHSMCMAIDLAELTTQRIKILQDMLHPSEGDVCAYSWKE
jgi:uncharacterized protein YecT (DUF1311 family)